MPKKDVLYEMKIDDTKLQPTHSAWNKKSGEIVKTANVLYVATKNDIYNLSKSQNCNPIKQKSAVCTS